MTISPLPIVLALAASLPAGIGAGLAARKLSQTKDLPLAAAIFGCLAVAGWASSSMPTPELLAVTCLLGWTLLVLAAVDVMAFRLPDVLTLPLIAAGLVASWFLPPHDLLGHAIGAVAGFIAFYGIAVLFRMARGKEGLGLGDAKLAAAAGAWLGWQALSFVVLLACAVGFVWFGLAMLRRGRAALGERIPFGVALALAIWIVWLYGVPAALGPVS